MIDRAIRNRALRARSKATPLRPRCRQLPDHAAAKPGALRFSYSTGEIWEVTIPEALELIHGDYEVTHVDMIKELA